MQTESLDRPDCPRPDQFARAGLSFVMLISLVSAMGGFLFGYETVVIAGTISLVKAQFQFSALMEGWFVSSGLVGCVAGVVVAGLLCDTIGRKNVMILSGALLSIAAVVCALAPSVDLLVIGRLLGGAGVGLASIVSPLYISELAPAQYRGRLVSLFQVTITLGIVVAMLLNAQLMNHALAAGSGAPRGWVTWLLVDQVWRGMFLGQLVPAGLFFIFAFWVPESPRWLVLRGRTHAAGLTLKRIYSDDVQIQAEMRSMAVAIERDQATVGRSHWVTLRRPLFIGVFLAVFSELSGITVVMYYGPTILEQAGASAGASLDGHSVIGLVLAAFTLLALPLVDRVGRRRVLLIGIVGACLSLASIGVCFSRGVSNGAVIVALLCMFVAFFSFSIGPIKWIVIAEIFPTGARAFAMSLATVALWVTDITVNLAFPVVRDYVGVAVMFFAFAALLIVHFIIVSRKLPETRGIPLEQIVSLWK